MNNAALLAVSDAIIERQRQPKWFFFAPADKVIKEQLYEWPLVVRTPHISLQLAARGLVSCAGRVGNADGLRK